MDKFSGIKQLIIPIQWVITLASPLDYIHFSVMVHDVWMVCPSAADIVIYCSH